MTLFSRDDVIGTFRGFSHGGLEFHADVVLPYASEFQALPMHGQFVVVSLEHDGEGVLGRITTVSSEGRLVSSVGEDFAARAVLDEREIPEDLRERYLKYKVDIRVLGVLRDTPSGLVFVPSHRRLPHVGAKVAFLSDHLLVEVAGAGKESTGAELGWYALGEFLYAAGDQRLAVEPWMQVMSPAVLPRFDASDLVSRRSFVFARAGFGKSNLIKLLFAELYRETPTVARRGGVQAPVGTVIFDPDGEYFWPDFKGRPGLCDVPHLVDRLVVFTNREGPSAAYSSFVVEKVKLDIRELRPSRVLGIALAPERQEQQNVQKLKGLAPDRWQELVDEIWSNGNTADLAVVGRILDLQMPAQQVEAIAARSNMVTVVRTLHDPSSRLLRILKDALRRGLICVVDISQMRGKAGLDLAGIILNEIFEHNQAEFTGAAPETIPTIAVIEEAQAVLGGASANSEGPFVSWVKEGRKYDLGAVLVTQQPGAISTEILSQGDNWFVFHLVSAVDLGVLKRANSHYSDDLLATLLNEPIPGHGVFWSSAGESPYPIPLRVLDFNSTYPNLLDAELTGDGLTNAAQSIRERFEREIEDALGALGGVPPEQSKVDRAEAVDGDGAALDPRELLRSAAIARLRSNEEFLQAVQSDRGLPWRGVMQFIMDGAPDTIDDARQWAYDLVAPAMNSLFGPDGWASEMRPRADDSGRTTSWVKASRAPMKP